MFVNRKVEISRLRHTLALGKAQLIVIYGRRRCGKSTMLKHIMDKNMIYFSADMNDTPVQIRAFAEQVERTLPGFAAPVYPDWNSLFRSLDRSLKERITVCIDEFPYLVKNSPGLPSVLQNIHDDEAHNNFHLILCGSSQTMMQDIVLNSKAPLYGRAGEIMKIGPMTPYYLMEYLGTTASEAVSEYSIWGGVPRYWEIRKSSGSLDSALRQHVINQYGLLAEEPERLFSDEIRTSVQVYTLLTLIGSGCHRISEIAGRMGKPATHLSGVLGFLTDLKYIRREIPFGEDFRSTKKSLYKIDDPFLNFWFNFVVPAKSSIDLGLTSQVMKRINSRLPLFISFAWENMCRQSLPFLIKKLEFGPASRWWGKDVDGNALEIDIISESADKKTLLIGEAKWTDKNDIKNEVKILTEKASRLTMTKGKELILALFLKNKTEIPSGDFLIFGPDDVVEASACF